MIEASSNTTWRSWRYWSSVSENPRCASSSSWVKYICVSLSVMKSSINISQREQLKLSSSANLWDWLAIMSMYKVKWNPSLKKVEFSFSQKVTERSTPHQCVALWKLTLCRILYNLTIKPHLKHWFSTINSHNGVKRLFYPLNYGAKGRKINLCGLRHPAPWRERATFAACEHP